MNTISRTPSAQLFHETHPLTEADIASFRAHEGEIDDEHDAARDYEAEEGRYPYNPWAWRIYTACLLVAVCWGVAAVLGA
jgi:hypothetical protein